MKRVIFTSCVAVMLTAIPNQTTLAEEKTGSTSSLQSMQQTLSKLERLLAAQEQRIKQLENENAALNLKDSAQVVSGVSKPSQPAAVIASNALNPEIGVVADVTALLSESEEDSEGNDKISLRELELVFGHDIDPYSRLDVTVTLSDFEDVALEEAYLTHTGLSDYFSARLGRLKPNIGIASKMHRDSLDTVDQPLVVQEYLGVEGLSRSALELTAFTPLSSDTFIQQLTVGVMEGGIGEGGTLFGETTRRPTTYARVKNALDLSADSSIDLGATFLRGSSDEDSDYEVNAYGLDLTLTHYLNPINRIKWQNELYIQDRDEPSLQSAGHAHEEEEEGAEHEEDHDEDTESLDGSEELEATSFKKHPFGFYSLLDYRLSERFSLGLRYDWFEPVNIDEHFQRIDESAISTYLTLHQSEFARWRAQYQRVDLLEGGSDNRFMLQATAAIGVHKHKIQ